MPVALEHSKGEREQGFAFPFHFVHSRVRREHRKSKSYQKKTKKYR